jgi:transposase
VWAIGGSGSYGAGLAAFLGQRGERVVEIGRRARRNRPTRAESDPLDAAREALSQPRQAAPRAPGDREALRGSGQHSRRCCPRAHRRDQPTTRTHRRRAGTTPRHPARPQLRRARRALHTCARKLEKRRAAPAHSHSARRRNESRPCPPRRVSSPERSHRFRSEAASAMLAGASPIPASSGQTVRHRLNRGGDCQLNCALDTIALSRRATRRPTRDYIDRRIRDGKSTRDINRCLKRHLNRLLERSAMT